jgi:hypothetical protein
MSYQYTDPALKPAWNGKRWRAIEQWPTKRELWDEYILIRKDCQQSGDTKAT